MLTAVVGANHRSIVTDDKAVALGRKVDAIQIFIAGGNLACPVLPSIPCCDDRPLFANRPSNTIRCEENSIELGPRIRI